jgi:uncharacterized cupredoxin-like copper-binding protein
MNQSASKPRSLSRRLGRIAAATALLVVGASLGACGQAASTPTSNPTTRTRGAAAGTATVAEWKVDVPATVTPGSVSYAIKNGGTVPHELLVFKADLAPSAYPLTPDGNINEEDSSISKVSDGDNLDPGASQTRTIDLTQKGTYLFVCNLSGHFKSGMFKTVTVS